MSLSQYSRISCRFTSFGCTDRESTDCRALSVLFSVLLSACTGCQPKHGKMKCGYCAESCRVRSKSASLSLTTTHARTPFCWARTMTSSISVRKSVALRWQCESMYCMLLLLWWLISLCKKSFKFWKQSQCVFERYTSHVFDGQLLHFCDVFARDAYVCRLVARLKSIYKTIILTKSLRPVLRRSILWRHHLFFEGKRRRISLEEDILKWKLLNEFVFLCVSGSGGWRRNGEEITSFDAFKSDTCFAVKSVHQHVLCSCKKSFQ